MLKFRRVAVAWALAGAAAAAPAAEQVWGMHDGFDVAIGSALGGSTTISDTYSFSLGAASTLITTAVSVEAAHLDLTGATVSLYSGMVGSGSFLGAFAFDNQAVTMSLAPLLPGLYYYLVTGSVAGDALAGVYGLVSRAVPVVAVNETESVALMLAGLAATGFLALRRRQSWL